MRSRLFPTLIAAACCTLTASVLTTGPTASAADDRSPDPRPMSRTKHSSDGVRGKIAPPLAAADKRAAPTVSNLMTWPIAPGVTFTQWDRSDTRGTIRAYLTAADLDTPGLGIDYLGSDTVRSRDEVLDMVVAEGGLVGVNADFFDISDTGAALGFGVDKQEGLLHGVAAGWNVGFYIDAAGLPQIGPLALDAQVKGHPELTISGVNSPTVAGDSVGVYTPAWGTTVGSRVTDGQTKSVREVTVRGGRVVSNHKKLSSDKEIHGLVLIGRGKAAKRLAKLRVGRKVRVKTKAAGGVQVAVGGNKQLVDERVRTVIDDREMHPRTAVGIDRDTNTVLLLVIDGRQSFSRGYTMVELANLMLELGAEDALNLDGGGSSTMVGLQPEGALAVLNSPSDGRQRKVPDGLQLTYLPPPA